MFKMNTMCKPKLVLVIPCYNEELVITSTVKTLLAILDNIQEKGKISIRSIFLERMCNFEIYLKLLKGEFYHGRHFFD